MKSKDPNESIWNLFSKTEAETKPPAKTESSFTGLFTREEGEPTTVAPKAPPAEAFTKDAEEPTTAAPRTPPNCALEFDEDFVFWAMRNIPVKESTKSFLICGAAGSGKSIGIDLFLKSIAPRFKPGRPTPEQLVIFDAKSNTVPMLAALDLRPEDENYYIINPFDSRSAVWNIAEAVQMPVMAEALGFLLIPEEQNTTAPYFSQSARNIVIAVITALNAVHRDNWTLRDLLCALSHRKQIVAVTEQHPPSAAIVAQYFDDSINSPGVLSTLASKLNKYSAVAALWSANTSGRKFTITEFLKRPGVLVLGNDPMLRESFWPLNAILLRALTQEILRRPDSLPPRHWFVLDEFRAMQRVDCIHTLLNEGRSKGASVMIGIQSIEGIIDIYGQEKANDLLGMCAAKTFLRAGGHKTAEWAEQHFNKVRQKETTVSYSSGSGNSSTTVQHALHERSMFLASVFLDLKFPVVGGTYEAICDAPSTGETIIIERAFDEVHGWRSKPELSFELSVDDLMAAVSLALKLKNRVDAISAYVGNRLSDSTQTGLAAWQSPSMPSEDLQKALVKDFNSILRGESIWDEARFNGVDVRAETLNLLKSNPIEDELVRVNRLLLEDAYQLEISRNKREKVIAVDMVNDVKKQTLWPWTPVEILKFCPSLSEKPKADPPPPPPVTAQAAVVPKPPEPPAPPTAPLAGNNYPKRRRGRRSA